MIIICKNGCLQKVAPAHIQEALFASGTYNCSEIDSYQNGGLLVKREQLRLQFIYLYYRHFLFLQF